MKSLSTPKGTIYVDDDIYDLIKDAPIAWRGDYPSICLHHLACKPKDGEMIDHINSNRLDARRENLRTCTASQNNMNRGKSKINSTSKYKGVSFSRQAKKYRIRVALTIDSKTVDLYDAKFSSEIEAAKARDICALACHGEFAHLNFPIQNYAGVDIVTESEKWKKRKFKSP